MQIERKKFVDDSLPLFAAAFSNLSSDVTAVTSSYWLIAFIVWKEGDVQFNLLVSNKSKRVDVDVDADADADVDVDVEADVLVEVEVSFITPSRKEEMKHEMRAERSVKDRRCGEKCCR